jgi:8-oxo-dGTP pyrophosphatase MutT (NUDIX family)
MIRASIGGGVFNFRVAGVFIRGGKALVHRGRGDDFYALPGGRVEMFEETGDALIREMKEELQADVRIERLLWICEDFYEYGGDKVHEICYYYLTEFLNPAQIQSDGSFWTVELDGSDLEFVWLPLADVEKSVIYPRFLRAGLLNLPDNIERKVDYEFNGGK